MTRCERIDIQGIARHENGCGRMFFNERRPGNAVACEKGRAVKRGGFDEMPGKIGLGVQPRTRPQRRRIAAAREVFEVPAWPERR